MKQNIFKNLITWLLISIWFFGWIALILAAWWKKRVVPWEIFSADTWNDMVSEMPWNKNWDNINYVSWNVWVWVTDPSVNLDVNWKIKMRATTSPADSSDIVATKWYVDTMLPPNCSWSDKALQWNNAWICKTLTWSVAWWGSSSSSSSSVQYLAWNFHTVDQCTFLNWTVQNDWTNKFCKFNQSACPSWWIRHSNWTATTAASASCPYNCSCGKECRTTCYRSCSTSSHARGNVAVESCTPTWWCTTAVANVTTIGCY